jgi:hypothetical protein
MPVFLGFETIFTSLTLAEGAGRPERTPSFFHWEKLSNKQESAGLWLW